MLKLVLDSLDGVPAGLHEAYEKRDGKFYLKLDDEVVDKKKFIEFRNNNMTLHDEMKSLKKKLADFEGIDPKKAKEAQKKLQELEDKKLIDENDIEGLLAKRTERMRADFEGQTKALASANEELKKNNEAMMSRLSQVLIDSEIQKAVSEVGTVRKGAMQDILARGRQTFKLVDGEPIPMDANGNTIYGKDGSSVMTFNEWANTLLEKASFLFEGSSGGGAGGAGGNSGGGGKVISSRDPIAFGEHLEDIAAGKVQVING